MQGDEESDRTSGIKSSVQDGPETTLVNVVIEVLYAMDLPPVSPSGNPETRKHYVVVRLGGTKRQTLEVAGTNPTWKERFLFTEVPANSTLTLEVLAVRRGLRGSTTSVVGELTDTLDSFTSDIFNAQGQLPHSNAMLHFRVERRTWRPLLDKIVVFCKIVDNLAEVDPYAKMAWSILSVVPQTIKQQDIRDDRMQKLYRSMWSLYTLVDDFQVNLGSQALEDKAHIMAQIAKQTVDCCYFIRDYAKDDIWKHMNKGSISSVDKRIQQYCDSFAKLKEDFDGTVTTRTHIVVARVIDIVQETRDQMVLNEMPYAEGATLCSREIGDSYGGSSSSTYIAAKMCFPGTRVDMLQKMTDWINADLDSGDPSRVLLIMGTAGTGKSSLARTIASRFAALGRLGASFAFDRNAKERTSSLLFPTLARDLAAFDPSVAKALISMVKNNSKETRMSRDLHIQFWNYILYPLKDLNFIGPIVIVIDALDECADMSNDSRQTLLSIISEHFANLPRNIRVVITTRMEHYIVMHLKGDKFVTMRMDDIDAKSSTQDISLYIRDRLLRDPAERQSILEGIDEWCCNRLAASSQGLFQWAYVACETIIQPSIGVSHLERYESLVMSGAIGSQANILDSQYQEVLSQLFHANKRGLERFKVVMAIIFAAFESLSRDMLDVFLRNADETFGSDAVIPYLGSLLQGSGVTSSTEPIRPLHTSLRSFLTDESRSGYLFVDTSAGHDRLALACLRIMLDGLKFNICKLESSYFRNDEVEGLDKRLKQFIPVTLSYASRFWGSHHECCTSDRFDDGYLGLVKQFLTTTLLFWLEILSLMGDLNTENPADMLRLLMRLPDPTVMDYAQDAWNFTTSISSRYKPRSSDRLATPHIYLSHLPFAPSGSMIKKCYGPFFRRTLSVSNAPLPEFRILLEPDDAIRLVAIASSETEVAAADSTGLVSVRETDRDSSRPVWPDYDVIESKFINFRESWTLRRERCGTFRTRPDSRFDVITSIAYSRDSRLICIGTRDKKVHVLDMETQENHIWSTPESTQFLVFHPTDRSRILSSHPSGRIVVRSPLTDNTIAQWKHKLNVDEESLGLPVAWSVDGAHVASGGEDLLVKLWNPESGELVGPPLAGHTKKITSIAVSPNGEWIASASRDGTVRIWDMAVFALICKLDHSDYTEPDAVRCIAISPDSCNLASCTRRTLSLWNLSTPESPERYHQDGPVFDSSYMAYKCSGETLVTGSASNVSLLPIVALKSRTMHTRTHDSSITCVNLTSDDKSIKSLLMFSRDPSHALRDVDLITEGKDLVDIEIGRDGWVKARIEETPSERLLFKVPENLQDRVVRPYRKAVVGAELVDIDLSNFVHGPRWAECYTPEGFDVPEMVTDRPVLKGDRPLASGRSTPPPESANSVLDLENGYLRLVLKRMSLSTSGCPVTVQDQAHRELEHLVLRQSPTVSVLKQFAQYCKAQAGTQESSAQGNELVNRILCTMQEINDNREFDKLNEQPGFTTRMLLKFSRNAAVKGMGSFGDVYCGSRLDHKVAVKRLRDCVYDIHKPATWFRSLFKEALMWRQLQHPAVLPFIGLDRTSILGTISLISPWMENGTIAAYLRAHDTTNISQKVKWINQIAMGLAYLHKKDVVHGDLRGDNILLDEQLNAHLADFGLSLLAGAGNSTMGLSTWQEGATRWMAPEVVHANGDGKDGGKCTAAGDVYSFGCVCLEIICGQIPFPGVHARNVATILQKQVPKWPNPRDHVQEVLGKHVRNCWNRAPGARPLMHELQQHTSQLLEEVHTSHD